MDKSIHRSEYRRLMNLLHEERVAAGLTQVDLAERIGEPQSFVAKYETCERRLDVLELRDVCVAIGTDMQALVERWVAGS